MIAGLLRPFDLVVVDGSLAMTAAPDFMMRWVPLFAERCQNATLIVSTRQTRLAIDIVEQAIILSDGQLSFAEKDVALRPIVRAAPEQASEVIELIEDLP